MATRRLALSALIFVLTFSGPGIAMNLSGASARTLYISPSGSDANTCTAAAACRTFNRAYRAATPGDSVQIGAGMYPAQTIAFDPTKAAAKQDVVFSPTAGANVSVGYLTVNGTHLVLSALTVNGWKIGTTADHVTMLGDTSTREITTAGAHNVLVKGGEVYSPSSVTTDSQISAYGPAIPTNVTYDGVWFHDFVDVGPGKLHHIECLQVGAGVNLTIKNSRFGPNCDTHDLFIRSWGDTVNGGPHPLDVKLTSNTFLRCLPGCYSLMAYDDLYTLSKTNLVVAGNTFTPGAGMAFRWEHGAAAFYDNLLSTMSAFTCGYRATSAALPASSFFHDNLFYGGSSGCGANAKTIASSAGLWLGNGDYHLADTSPARDLFTVGPVDDMDGDVRPMNGHFDAGADEAS
jgi:hypothetical protein